MNYWMIIISLLFSINTTALATPQLLNRIIAIVNNDIILQSDIDNMLNIVKINIKNTKQQTLTNTDKNITLYNQVLEYLIMDKIIMQIAKEKQIKIPDQEINAAIASIAASNKLTISQLKQQLLANGISFQYYRNYINKEMTITEVRNNEIYQRIVILPQEVKSLITKFNSEVIYNTNVNLNHILVPLVENSTKLQKKLAIDIANKIIAQLKQGINFNKLAITKSISHSILKNNFLTGWNKIEELPTIFAQEIKYAKKGDIIGPIRSNFGFHILKVNDLQNDNIVTLVTEVKARHILIRLSPVMNNKQAQNKIQEIAQLIKTGQITFAEAAKKYSQDSTSSSYGGDLGWNIPNNYDPILRDNLMKLNKGEISQPINSSFGWHLIQLEDIRKVDKTNIIKENQAYHLLFNRKFDEEVHIWMQEIRSSAYIKIINNNYIQSPL